MKHSTTQTCKTQLMKPLIILKYLLPACLLVLVIGQLSMTWRQLEQEMGEVDKVGDAREVKEVTEVKVPSRLGGTILKRHSLPPEPAVNVLGEVPLQGAASAKSVASVPTLPEAPATPSVSKKNSAASSQPAESVAQSGREPAVSKGSSDLGVSAQPSKEHSGVTSSPAGVMTSATSTLAGSSAGGGGQNSFPSAVYASPSLSSDIPGTGAVPPSASPQVPDLQQKDAGKPLPGVAEQSSQNSAVNSTMGQGPSGHGRSPYPLDYEVYKQQYGAQALNAQIMSAPSR